VGEIAFEGRPGGGAQEGCVRTHSSSWSAALGAVWILLLASGCPRDKAESAPKGEAGASADGRVSEEPPPGAQFANAMWSPDGSLVYYERAVAHEDGTATAEVRQVNVQTSEDCRVARGTECALSHDGTRLAYVAVDQVGNEEGAALLELASGAVTALPCASWGACTWSPDDDRLMYWAYWPMKLRVYRLGAGRETIPGDRLSSELGAWSPSGDAIAYVSDAEDPAAGEGLWLVEVGAGDERRLSDLVCPGSPVGPPLAWAPDADRLVVGARDAEGGRSLFLVTLDGAETKQLTQGPADYGPAWSPDGTMVAYTTRAGGAKRTHVAVVTLETGEERVFRQHALEAPAWSPDGTELACIDWQDGVYVVSVEELE